MLTPEFFAGMALGVLIGFFLRQIVLPLLVRQRHVR